ncbi:response regulator transcription factor [Flavobacterium alkalisoli]|uniref:Response regulator transcription factor n=1 Tax=Flavobacterium alkalisoli TaxID=2602769 RepID=A0A5B9FMH8_9FLAO|nr:response regulator transcription factor [Flavobacterium alkalisoli]QEE48080.1 response regulator transcription factor [Flavobacterium alkalisoli]
MNILIADDHSVVRQGVALILREAFNSVNIYHAESFSEIAEILKKQSINLILLDINLPGGNNVGMINNIKEIQSSIKVLMFSAYDEDQYAVRYIHAGVDGYLNKLSSEDKIIEAVSEILRGGRYFSDKIKDRVFESVINKIPENPLESLSNREMEIADLLAKGEGNLEIANRLDIKMSTVSTYKSRIFEKLGINNVVSLAEKFNIYRNSL